MGLQNRFTWLFGAISTLSGVLTFMDYLTEFGVWFSATFGDSITLDIRLGFYILGILLFPLYLIVSYLRTDITPNPSFEHLTVQYSQKKDSPDSSSPSRPYFIVNLDANLAYYVSDLIAPYIKKKMFQWNAHDGEKALKKFFKDTGITIARINRTAEELGLIIHKNGSLSALPKIIYELKNRKLDDLEIEWLFPWYYNYLPSRCRNKPPRKRLLRKFSTKETFKPPHYDLELIETNNITKDNYILGRSKFLSSESLTQWSTRYGYTYQSIRYSEEMLLAEK